MLRNLVTFRRPTIRAQGDAAVVSSRIVCALRRDDAHGRPGPGGFSCAGATAGEALRLGGRQDAVWRAAGSATANVTLKPSQWPPHRRCRRTRAPGPSWLHRALTSRRHRRKARPLSSCDWHVDHPGHPTCQSARPAPKQGSLALGTPLDLPCRPRYRHRHR
jgi:hypothetical protein